MLYIYCDILSIQFGFGPHEFGIKPVIYIEEMMFERDLHYYWLRVELKTERRMIIRIRCCDPAVDSDISRRS